MTFFDPFLKDFDPNDLKKSFSYEFFKTHQSILIGSVESSVQMRQIFNQYLSLVLPKSKSDEVGEKYNLRRARIVDKESHFNNYNREKRKQGRKVYKGFHVFLHTIFEKLGSDFVLFKDFLELYLIYFTSFKGK